MRLPEACHTVNAPWVKHATSCDDVGRPRRVNADVLAKLQLVRVGFRTTCAIHGKHATLLAPVEGRMVAV